MSIHGCLVHKGLEISYPCDKKDCTSYGKFGVKEIFEESGVFFGKRKVHKTIAIGENAKSLNCVACVHFNHIDLYRKRAE
jgi:hypothetical protein